MIKGTPFCWKRSFRQKDLWLRCQRTEAAPFVNFYIIAQTIDYINQQMRTSANRKMFPRGVSLAANVEHPPENKEYAMSKKWRSVISLAVMVAPLCSCGPVTLTLSDDPPEASEGNLAGGSASAKIEAAKPPPVRYAVSFDEDETFPDELSRTAAEHIAPCIQTAVELMNTMEEGEQYTVLNCDYSQHPT